MRFSILALVLFFNVSALAESYCKVEKAERVWQKYAPIFEQMNGVNSWEYGYNCVSDAVCLIVRTETSEQLNKIHAIFPTGIILDGCSVEFSSGQIGSNEL